MMNDDDDDEMALKLATVFSQCVTSCLGTNEDPEAGPVERRWSKCCFGGFSSPIRIRFWGIPSIHKHQYLF